MTALFRAAIAAGAAWSRHALIHALLDAALAAPRLDANPADHRDFSSRGEGEKEEKVEIFFFCCTYIAKFLSRKHLFLSSPAQSCTPTIPKMKKTKKHKRRTLPNIGRVSNSRVTSIRIPVGRRRKQVRGAL